MWCLQVLDAVFKTLDTDGSGLIGFDELFEFIRGRRHSLDARNKRGKTMKLEPPDGATLMAIKWNAETMRVMFKQMMVRCKMGPLDLMRYWDQSADLKLTRHEFINVNR